MIYILPFVMLTASHTTFVLCGLFYRLIFFHFHSRFTRSLTSTSYGCVCVCSCWEDENSVSFLQGNCRNYNRSAFQNQKKKSCDCVVYLLSIWLNCLIYAAWCTWNARRLAIDATGTVKIAVGWRCRNYTLLSKMPCLMLPFPILITNTFI